MLAVATFGPAIPVTASGVVAARVPINHLLIAENENGPRTNLDPVCGGRT